MSDYTSDYYSTRIEEVTAESKARAEALIQQARDGRICYTEAWYSMPGPAMSREYPFLSYAQVVDLDKAMRKEWDTTFWATNPAYPSHKELCDAARVWANNMAALHRRANADRIKQEGEAWLGLWEKQQEAVWNEREELFKLMSEPIDEDAAAEAEARRRLDNPKFESAVRRCMKQLQLEKE